MYVLTEAFLLGFGSPGVYGKMLHYIVYIEKCNNKWIILCTRIVLFHPSYGINERYDDIQ